MKLVSMLHYHSDNAEIKLKTVNKKKSTSTSILRSKQQLMFLYLNIYNTTITNNTTSKRDENNFTDVIGALINNNSLNNNNINTYDNSYPQSIIMQMKYYVILLQYACDIKVFYFQVMLSSYPRL